MNRPAYSIRPLAQADEPFLWQMLYQAIYVPPGADPVPPEIVNEPEIARYVQHWGRDGDEGFVAIDEMTRQAFGAAWMRLFTAADKGYGYVDDQTPELSIALFSKYRNLGIGAELLRRLIEAARERWPGLSLSVSAENPAIRLYERLGFEVVSESGSSLTMRKIFGNTAEQN
ncbi:MAG: N-acetyltransferase [Blastocatellia bacterium]